MFVPSFAVNATVYTPGVSYTCAASGPVAVLRLLAPTLLPLFQVVPLTGEPAESPKFHLYSKSWKGFAVALAVVPDASKNTDKGATPVKRLGTLESVMALVAPVVVHVEPATVTAVLWLAVPPGPVHVTE